LELLPLDADKKPSDDNLRKCKRCGKYYKNTDASLICLYHPGTFRYSEIMPAFWTCCKHGKSSPGCKQSKHIDDENLTVFMNEKLSTVDSHIEEKPKETPDTVRSTQNLNDIDMISHYVTDTDTLIGLSLRYGVTQESIRSINRMPTSDIQGYNVLIIPAREQPKDDKDNRASYERHLISTLRHQVAGVSITQAKYYLTLHDWNISEAIQECKEDIEWGKNNPLPTRLRRGK